MYGDKNLYVLCFFFTSLYVELYMYVTLSQYNDSVNS